jgi:hypothetical protein
MNYGDHACSDPDESEQRKQPPLIIPFPVLDWASDRNDAGDKRIGGKQCHQPQ